MNLPLTTMGDRIVLGLACLLVASLYGIYWQPSAAGTVVEYHTPTDHGRVNLDTERRLALAGSDGTSHIHIKDGAARFTASPCRNKQCIHSGWLQHSGDYAACLPNQVTLLVHGPQEPILDAINY